MENGNKEQTVRAWSPGKDSGVQEDLKKDPVDG